MGMGVRGIRLGFSKLGEIEYCHANIFQNREEIKKYFEILMQRVRVWGKGKGVIEWDG